MRYIILIVFMVVSLCAMENGVVVSEKDVDGVHISLVKVNAEVSPNIDNSTNKYNGTKSLVFYKLDGSTGVSKLVYKTVQNEHNKHVTIYYVEKNNENHKGIYPIFFNKKDVLFEKQEDVKLLDNNIGMITPLSETKKASSVSENQTDIFYLSLFSLGFFIAVIWVFFNSSGNIFSNIFFLKDRKKVSKKLFIIAVLIFVYCIVWFSIFNEMLSLKKIAIVGTLLKVGLFILLLSIYHFFMSFYNNNILIFNNTDEEDDDYDYTLNNDIYYDKSNTFNNVDEKDTQEELESINDFDDINSTENNATDEVEDFDDD